MTDPERDPLQPDGPTDLYTRWDLILAGAPVPVDRKTNYIRRDALGRIILRAIPAPKQKGLMHPNYLAGFNHGFRDAQTGHPRLPSLEGARDPYARGYHAGYLDGQS